MAQHKYDLVTLPTEPAGPPRHHPWYKERLDLKYAKRGQKLGCLDGRRWTLLAGNMDDFRTGQPAAVDPGSMVVKGKVDSLPLVNSSGSLQSSHVRCMRRSSPSARPGTGPGHSTLQSRVGPRRQSKLAHLQQLERQLLQRPLSLYPHLRESIPAEIAGEVLQLIEGQCQSQKGQKTDKISLRKEQEENEIDEDKKQQEEEVSGTRKIYHWPLRQTEEEVKEEKRALAVQRVISPGQEARVSHVTHSLVQWGRDLGGSGETPDINEAAVKNLFSGDYESRPMMTPERVVDVPDVPLELLRDTSARFSAGSRRSSLWDADTRRRSLTAPVFSSDLNVYSRPHCVKSRYGAWYLPTTLWKLQNADEPLHDPRNLTSESTEELARQNQELDLKVSQLHGAEAFRRYYSAHKPGSTLPSFLRCVAGNASSQDFHSSTRNKISS